MTSCGGIVGFQPEKENIWGHDRRNKIFERYSDGRRKKPWKQHHNLGRASPLGLDSSGTTFGLYHLLVLLQRDTCSTSLSHPWDEYVNANPQLYYKDYKIHSFSEVFLMSICYQNTR